MLSPSSLMRRAWSGGGTSEGLGKLLSVLCRRSSRALEDAGAISAMCRKMLFFCASGTSPSAPASKPLPPPVPTRACVLQRLVPGTASMSAPLTRQAVQRPVRGPGFEASPTRTPLKPVRRRNLTPRSRFGVSSFSQASEHVRLCCFPSCCVMIGWLLRVAAADSLSRKHGSGQHRNGRPTLAWQSRVAAMLSMIQRRNAKEGQPVRRGVPQSVSGPSAAI